MTILCTLDNIMMLLLKIDPYLPTYKLTVHCIYIHTSVATSKFGINDIVLIMEFKPACHTFIYAKDVSAMVPGSSYDSYMDNDAIVAKVTFSEEACRKYHLHWSSEQCKQPSVNKTVEACENHDSDDDSLGSGADWDEADFETVPPYVPVELNHEDDSQGSTLDMRCYNYRGDELAPPSSCPVAPTIRWPRVEQPLGTGIRSNEVLVPAGAETNSDDELDDLTLANKQADDVCVMQRCYCVDSVIKLKNSSH